MKFQHGIHDNKINPRKSTEINSYITEYQPWCVLTLYTFILQTRHYMLQYDNGTYIYTADRADIISKHSMLQNDLL